MPPYVYHISPLSCDLQHPENANHRICISQDAGESFRSKSRQYHPPLPFQCLHFSRVKSSRQVLVKYWSSASGYSKMSICISISARHSIITIIYGTVKLSLKSFDVAGINQTRN